MSNREVRANIILISIAIIWGFAFPIQKQSADYLSPFSINAIRFFLASITLIPVILFWIKSGKSANNTFKFSRLELLSGTLTGAVLFLASFLQQLGLETTTSVKAAFITGLYVVIVPIVGIFMKQKVHISIWLSVLIATVGMYFLSINSDFTIAPGDLVVFTGAFFWAAHIIVVGIYSVKVDLFKFAFLQFASASFLSFIAAFIMESDTFTVFNVQQAIWLLLFLGIISTALCYTLQIIGQKDAKPAPAAVILSMEALFATLAGFLILNETLSEREIIGCVLMFSAMMLAQFKDLKGFRK